VKEREDQTFSILGLLCMEGFFSYFLCFSCKLFPVKILRPKDRGYGEHLSARAV
jgi:hypothetical protein